MKRLIFMRHAKSDWALGLPDRDRPLNARGRRSAPVMGDWLRSQGIVPDEVLCSDAARTQETLALTGFDIRPQLLPALYLADPSVLLETLRGASGACVLLLAHNPGMAILARQIVAFMPKHPRFSDYPTCATLVADFNIENWTELTPGTGATAAFAVPRDFDDQRKGGL